MAKVKFKRFISDSAVESAEIEDGSFIVSKSGTSYVDFGNERIAFGGTSDTAMSDTSINSVQNKVVKSYVDDSIDTVNDTIDTKITEVKNGLQFINGTVIKSVANNDATSLFTLTQLRTQFNAPSATNTQFYAIVNNGDGGANGKHFESCTWVGNTLYVVWDGVVSGTVSTRINYLIFYIP